MNPAGWKKTGSDMLLDHSIIRLRRDRVVNPRNQREMDAFVLECPDWVNIIALTPDEQVVMIRQFRHGVQRIMLEIPGGVVDAGESPLNAAGRELLEETGYEADELVHIGTVDAQPAIQDNELHTFLALGAKKVAEPAPDEGEDLEVVTYPLAEVDGMIRAGEISHALILTAFQWLHLRGKC